MSLKMFLIFEELCRISNCITVMSIIAVKTSLFSVVALFNIKVSPCNYVLQPVWVPGCPAGSVRHDAWHISEKISCPTEGKQFTAATTTTTTTTLHKLLLKIFHPDNRKWKKKSSRYSTASLICCLSIISTMPPKHLDHVWCVNWKYGKAKQK